MPTQLRDLLAEMHTRIHSTHLKWEVHAKTFGSAYETASAEHHDALKQARILLQEDADFLFQALELLTYGLTTGWIAKAVGAIRGKFDPLQHWAFDPLDTATGWVGDGIDRRIKADIEAGIVKYQVTTPAISKSPMKFQNDLEKGLAKVTSGLLDVIADLQKSYSDVTVDDVMAGVFRRSWEASSFFDVPTEFDEAEVAKELELVMWALWATKKLNWCNNPAEVQARREKNAKEKRRFFKMANDPDLLIKQGRCYDTNPLRVRLARPGRIEDPGPIETRLLLLGVADHAIGDEEITTIPGKLGAFSLQRVRVWNYKPQKVFQWGVQYLKEPKRFGDPVTPVLGPGY
jgi:hypothetical protein